MQFQQSLFPPLLQDNESRRRKARMSLCSFLQGSFPKLFKKTSLILVLHTLYLSKNEKRNELNYQKYSWVLTLRISEWRTQWLKKKLSKDWYPCRTAGHFKVLPKFILQKLQCPKALSNQHILASKGDLKHSKKRVVHLKDVVCKTNSPCITDNTYKALSFWPRHLISYRSGGSGRVN